MTPRATLTLLASLAGCAGETGTIVLELATAPGSTVLDAATLLRVTLTSPRAVFEVARGATGFDLSIEVDANDQSGALIVEAFDASADLVATGRSPAFPVGPIDARIVIYVAAPMSIEPAAVGLTPVREQVAVGALPYGAILVGGREVATGEASDAVAIYNAYDHTLVAGLALPAPRIGVGLGVGGTGAVYLYGGADGAGTPTGTLWRFNTGVAPSGSYSELADEPGFARSGELVVPSGMDRFVITGAPVLELTGSAITPRAEPSALGPSGAGVVASDGVPTAVFADVRGITRFRDGTFTVLSTAPRDGARTVALPDGTALVIGDASGDAVRVDAASGALTVLPGFIGIPCPTPAATATSRHLLISCATQTFVFDVASLGPIATIPRAGTGLTPLPNDQVLLIGGPTGLQLFTPPPPP